MFGIISFYSKRGFGFLRTNVVTDEDLFFHVRDFDGHESKLVKGARVEFELGRNKGKQVARNIRLLAAAEADTESDPLTTKIGAAALGSNVPDEA